MSQSLSPLISIQGLTKKYNKLVAVDNLYLDIHESCFALLGSNGAGKTTIMLMLLGLVKPTNGTAFILGKKISKNLTNTYKIGFLPENVGFYPNSTGREHIELLFGLRNNMKDRRKNAELLLKWCGLKKEFWAKKVSTYSKGMRQRLGIAQAFAGDPKIVILDEPLSNIDPLGRDELIKKIQEKIKEGIIILISSHIVSEIEQISDSVAIIDNGKIKASGYIFALAQSYGFNEYEINIINKNSRISLNELNEILFSEKDLFMEKPKVLSEKIIFRSDNPNEIKNNLKKYEDFEIKPLYGTLGKIYKKVIKKK